MPALVAEDQYFRKREDMTSTIRKTEASDVEPGQRWRSIRSKHHDLIVEVQSVQPTAVNVIVREPGSSQNNRKVVGHKWHIGMPQFLNHYEMANPPIDIYFNRETKPIQDKELRMPVAAAQPKITNVAMDSNGHMLVEGYEFNIQQYLERAVQALKRWGGAPVKQYTLTQMLSSGESKNRLNSTRTAQLVEYGVKLGLLDSWETPDTRKRNSFSKWVGLFGQRNILTIPELEDTSTLNTSDISSPVVNPLTKRHTRRFTKEDFAVRAQETIQRQFSLLTPEHKAEIVSLLTDPVKPASVQEIQKAYKVMGGVVGLIKREAGLSIVRTATPRVKQQRAPRQLVPVKAAPLTEVETAEWESELAEVLRNAKPTPKLVTKTPRNDRTQNALVARALLADTFTVEQTQFNVTALIMTPSEQTITVTANSFADAERKALMTEHIVEVLSVVKVR